MKNQNVQKGKKLNKKELRVIKGGLMDCIDPFTGLCKKISIGCAQLECRPEIVP
ncbi:hypothetical protein [Chryseobacterium oryctis]|uniref:Bacteriocin-type signal sequence-containing protein n=1 Tax=Chryseobacterium oryctis TaxID=2952618 RepID=A0ABT3HMY8_9FLAO|nr:hypothetical protein [Chryseobacterium oryctis]MCW3161114.1 hypothetical protein [Chryseobacterium oryctis]